MGTALCGLGRGYKQSGFGRFGGIAGLNEYLQTKTVFIAA
jgi:acyl-CoA reductase-like NAD-dependent aldehyde dehydrogenase